MAVEADLFAYLSPGYSGLLSVSFRNGPQVAIGLGSDRLSVVPLIWIAGARHFQVFRTTYRFRGPLKNGPAVGVVVRNEFLGLRVFNQTQETTFRTVRVGLLGGYYQRVGRHFYLYPTAAYTRNTTRSGNTTPHGPAYSVKQWSSTASVHAGWEWAWKR